MKIEFPKNFTWGVATAAQQIEGAAFEDGRGPSIWDAFSRLPGRTANGDLPDVACDSYHRFREDVALMKQMGVRSYRFSFSWPRILPDGVGEVNPEGIRYYKELLACLRENGITANATMYHWDLPYALQCKGGFGNREIVQWFTRYAEVLLDNFGDDVDLWATFNEPIAVFVGYALGGFAPGLRDEKYARAALHHLLLCHGEAVKLFRQKKPRGQVGIVVDVWKHYPARPGNREDEESAEKNNEALGYGMFLHPLFLGGYSEVHERYMRERAIYPEVREGDFETIRQPLDFYGLNFYNGLYDNADAIRQAQAQGGNYQDRPESHPEAIRDVLHMVVEKYGVRIPIYITENGLPQSAALPKEEILDDQERIAYVRQVLTHLHEAMEDGIDVRGYYLWSLLDNFEWSAGYSMRYGLYYTDYGTLERIPKKSAGWYAAVIRENGFETA